MPKYLAPPSAGGSDSNDGNSLLNPYATPRKLCDNLASGDVGYVRGGDYTGLIGDRGSSDWNWNIANGSDPDYTTIQAYEGEPVRFIPALNTFAAFPFRNSATYIKVQGIEFQANTNSGFQEGFNQGSGGGGSFVWLQSVHVHGFTGQGLLTADMTDGKLLDSLFHNLGTDNFQHGIYLSGGSHRWEVGRNTFHTITGFGIHHYSGGSKSDDCRYHNNLIYNYGSFGGSGIIVANGDDTWVWNNIITDPHVNGSDGIILDFSSSGNAPQGILIFHNVIYRARKNGINIQEGGNVTPSVVRNNAIVDWNQGGTGGREAIKDVPGNATISNNLEDDGSANPIALWSGPNDGTRNFHVLAGASSLIEQGLYNANFALDRDGVTRVASPAPDIGPYQYGASFPPSIVIPEARTTQISVPFSFSEFDVSHSGDLDNVMIYADRGVL